MLKISKVNNMYISKDLKTDLRFKVRTSPALTQPSDLKSLNADNYKAYIPSFTGAASNTASPSLEQQYNTVKSFLNHSDLKTFNALDKKGILMNNKSNDGSTVLSNMYKIVTQPRLQGLDKKQILSEVIKALDNPASITQKFGDIPAPVAKGITKETGNQFPQQAYNVMSSSCVVASMEYCLASKNPAEFVRFAEGLSGNSYSVDKRIDITDMAQGTAESLFKLRQFNTDCYFENNWEKLNVKIKPDRNAIVRARVQTSYKDPGERSCIDVLIQSALLNLGSQNTYDALTDERTGHLNPDKTGLTEEEKNFVERIVFEKPVISVVYQNIQDGKLAGYNCEPQELKNHLLKSLELNQNIIIGRIYTDSENNVKGGHELTVIGYEQDKDGNGYFICNDTDDGIDAEVKISEKELLPYIHHAGIPKEALSKDDVIVEPWKEVIAGYKQMISEEQTSK